jgi:hypothetical protein
MRIKIRKSNTMTQREKILAAMVGLTVFGVAAIFLVQRIQSEFARKENSLAQLEQDVANQDRVILQGKKAAARLDDYAQRSLPPDPALARSLYQDWLLDQAVEVGLAGVNVSPLPSRPVGEVYVQHSFLISGRGDLQKMVDFLYEFYNRGYLHRIKTLSAKRISRSKEIDLSITVDAISLLNAPEREDLHDPPASRPPEKEREEYLASIVNRNMLGFANQPPEISDISTQTGNPGSPIRFRVQAEDPDEWDELSYSLNGTTLEGARIDPDTGEFEWVPEELGEYEVEVSVSDNGLPAKTRTETIKIAVVEPPPPVETPPPMGFDVARQSIVTGITDDGGRREVWVSIRTEGKILKLAVGDEISVGSVQGVIRRIDQRTAEIETADGQVLVVGLGQSLRPSQAPPLGDFRAN